MRKPSLAPDSQPERYDGGDVDCGEVGCGEAVVSGCDTPEVLQPAEHPLDGVATAVECGAEAVLPAPVCLRRDVRHRAARFDRASEAIRIEGAISDHQGALGNSLDQRLAAAEVGCVATGEMERDRLAGLVCRGVDLGGPAAARAPDGLRVLPPFPPEALRCAFA